MNKKRRKQLEAIKNQVDELKSSLDTLMDEEKGYLDNLPESWQSSETAATAEAAVSSMKQASELLDSAMSELEEAQNG